MKLNEPGMQKLGNSLAAGKALGNSLAAGKAYTAMFWPTSSLNAVSYTHLTLPTKVNV